MITFYRNLYTHIRDSGPKIYNLVGWCIIALLLSACSLSSDKSSHNSRPQYPSIVWPSAPAKPRILFNRVIRQGIDLGIEKSFFTKVVDFFVGDKPLLVTKPMAIVVRKDNTIFIADPGVGGIHKISIENNEHSIIHLKNGKLMATPVALALDDDRVFISDSTLGVFSIEANANIAKPVKLDPPPERAIGIAHDKLSGNLYIVDTVKHQLKVYNKLGKLINTIGRRGIGDGEFNHPTMVWLTHDDKLLVSDSLNFRIQIFSKTGQFLRKFGEMGLGTGHQSRPKGIATDSFGHIYVVDSLFHSVQVFDQEGKFLLNFGTQGGNYGEFWLPAGIFIGGKNKDTIYVADTHNRRLQVFSYIGG